MKVLVTGGGGFIGRHVLSTLSHNNVDFVCLGRTPNRNGVNNYKKFDLLNVKDISNLIKDVNPTHLIHLAWYTEHGEYWDSPRNMNWMEVTYYLLTEFYKNGGEHAFIAGSCAEYDWRYGYCVEDLTPTTSQTIYGLVKDSTRRMSQQICDQYGASLTWARIFFPYGEGEEEARLIPSLFKVFENKLPAFGVNSNMYRDFLHVTDVAKAITMCSEKKAQGLINISSGQPVLIENIVRMIAGLSNQEPNKILNLTPKRKAESIMLVGENERLKALGWQQNISLEMGLLNYSRKKSYESVQEI